AASGVTRHGARAAVVAIDVVVGRPSRIRSSTVPKLGWGVMSHQISRIELIDLAEISVVISSWNCSQPPSSCGTPAVGSPSNTLERDDANPVSRPSNQGLDAERARKWGM